MLVLAFDLLGFLVVACRLLPGISQQSPGAAQKQLFEQLCTDRVLQAVASALSKLKDKVWPLLAARATADTSAASGPSPAIPPAALSSTGEMGTRAALNSACEVLLQSSKFVALLMHRTPGLIGTTTSNAPSTESIRLLRCVLDSNVIPISCSAYLSAPVVPLEKPPGKLNGDAEALGVALENLGKSINLCATMGLVNGAFGMGMRVIAKAPPVLDLVRAAADRTVELEVWTAGGGGGGSGPGGGSGSSPGGGCGDSGTVASDGPSNGGSSGVGSGGGLVASYARYPGGGWPRMQPGFHRLSVEAGGIEPWDTFLFLKVLTNIYGPDDSTTSLGLKLEPAEATSLALRLARARALIESSQDEPGEEGEGAADAGRAAELWRLHHGRLPHWVDGLMAHKSWMEDRRKRQDLTLLAKLVEDAFAQPPPSPAGAAGGAANAGGAEGSGAAAGGGGSNASGGGSGSGASGGSSGGGGSSSGAGSSGGSSGAVSGAVSGGGSGGGSGDGVLRAVLMPAALEAQATAAGVLLRYARAATPDGPERTHQALSMMVNLTQASMPGVGPGLTSGVKKLLAGGYIATSHIVATGFFQGFDRLRDRLNAWMEGLGHGPDEGSTALARHAHHEAAKRLAGAGLLRSLDSFLRLVLSYEREFGPRHQVQPFNTVSLVFGLGPMASSVLKCSLAGSGSDSGSGSGGRGGADDTAATGSVGSLLEERFSVPQPLPPLPWSPTRDLGVWVTCAKLMRRAVWDAERGEEPVAGGAEGGGGGQGGASQPWRPPALPSALISSAVTGALGQHGLSVCLREHLRRSPSGSASDASAGSGVCAWPEDSPAALAEAVALVARFGLPCAALRIQSTVAALKTEGHEQPSTSSSGPAEPLAGLSGAITSAESASEAVMEAATVLPASELLAAQPLRALWAVAAVLEAAAAATPEEQAAVQAADRCPRLSESLATAAAAVCAAVAEAAQADATLEPVARALLHPSPSGVGGLGVGGVASWHPAAAAALAQLEAVGEAAEPGAEDGSSSVAGALAALAHAVGSELSGPERWEELQRDRREVAAALSASVLRPPGRRLYPPSVLRLCGHAGCSTWDGEHEGRLKLRRCGGCGVERYCGPECQRAAWREGHSAVCAGRAAARVASRSGNE
ncbi:hypothetical protein HYH03_009624 [Edaphochlamys debaryana]|uniref:MYND-type domain-containing protein n=1 Tax=Edaphochlamys debaryana TaxID=47281 RepID=A0A836BYB5_9CHLO|nr:hypothetical protein HYH03_009624 [Edaphochlamys debaryana]|eukprot:KAG2492133.1 hypothetical protein HYH03_009624 [Edaphochlamys debaryana]